MNEIEDLIDEFIPVFQELFEPDDIASAILTLLDKYEDLNDKNGQARTS